MSRDNEPKPRTRRDRIARLRQRIRDAAIANREDPLPGILAGILDLIADMEDEL